MISECGELLVVHMILDNGDDLKPVAALTKDLIGKLFGDKSNLSKPLRDHHTLTRRRCSEFAGQMV